MSPELWTRERWKSGIGRKICMAPDSGNVSSDYLLPLYINCDTSFSIPYGIPGGSSFDAFGESRSLFLPFPDLTSIACFRFRQYLHELSGEPLASYCAHYRLGDMSSISGYGAVSPDTECLFLDIMGPHMHTPVEYYYPLLRLSSIPYTVDSVQGCTRGKKGTADLC